MVSNEIFAYVYFFIKITKSEALKVAVNRKCHIILISRNKAWGIDCIISSILSRISNTDSVCRRPLRAALRMFFGLAMFGPGSLGMATPRQLDLWATAASCLCHSDKPSRHLGWNLISSRGTTWSTRWEEVVIQRGRRSRSRGAMWDNWSSRFAGRKNKKKKVPVAPSELGVPESRVHQFSIAATLSVSCVSGLIALLSLLT